MRAYLPKYLVEIIFLWVCIANVMQKLAVKGRSQAVVELVRLGELKI
jgi:LuxR family transcriptional regulator of spore coat protein